MHKMYHYTCRQNIALIQKDGIKLGQSPLLGPPVVSMTVNGSPERLGLHFGAVLTEGIDPEFEAAKLRYPSLLSKNADGKGVIRMFNQMEMRIEVSIPEEFASNILTYEELFRRDAKIMIGQRLSDFPSEIQKFFWATPIHSADYPFSTAHLDKDQVTKEIIEIAVGLRTHRADDWRFSTEKILAEYITNIESCRSDGTYGI